MDTQRFSPVFVFTGIAMHLSCFVVCIPVDVKCWPKLADRNIYFSWWTLYILISRSEKCLSFRHSIAWIFQNFLLSPTIYFKLLGKKQCCREGPRKSHCTALQKFHLPSLKQFAWVCCQSLDLTCGGTGQTWDQVSGFARVIRSMKNHIQNGDSIQQIPCLCYKLIYAM